MKFGFSSAACPEWDLTAIISQAAGMGYQAVELCGLGGEMHLAACPSLVGEPAVVAGQFRDAGVDLACLATVNSLYWPDVQRAASHKRQVSEVLELAGRLGCPYVRVFCGAVPRGRDKNAVLVRIVDTLHELAAVAMSHRTTIVVENRGDFAGSRDSWFIVDSVNHPAVQCCWNPCHAWLAGERPSRSVPRLGTRIALTHLLDAKCSPAGAFESYAIPGEGQVDIERYLDILRGIGYQGYLIFDWPKRWIPALAGPETVLPAALSRVKGMLDQLAGAPELTAYKGDKGPRLAPPRPRWLVGH